MPDLSSSFSRSEATDRAVRAFGIIKAYMEDFSSEPEDRFSSDEKKAAREEIVNLSWEAAFGNVAAVGLLKLLSGETHPLAVEVSEISKRHVLFKELAGTKDPIAFAQRLDGYLDGVTQELLSRLRQGTQGREGIRRYAEALQYGPANFILQLYQRKFSELLENGLPQHRLSHVVRHDFLNPIVSSTMLFLFWDRDLSEEALEWLGALERLRGPGPELLTHAAKALFPRSLQHVMQEHELGIDLPVGLRYRQGLALVDVGQILVELANNARKYADRHKEHRFMLLSWDESLRALVVTDNGSGIAEPERIWEAGAREALRHPGIEGSGLGLYSVRERVERLGWGISVASKVDVGTRFVLQPAEGDVIAAPSSIDPLLAQRVAPSPNMAAAAALLSASLLSSTMIRTLH